MSGAAALLASVERQGIQLRVEDGRLRFTAPAGAVTPEIREHLRSHKAELMSLLEPIGAPRLYPASFVQRRFWTLQQLNPKEGFYNIPFVFGLRGQVDSGVLRLSFDAVVRRHESLRTTLEERDGKLMQVIAPSGTIKFTEETQLGVDENAVLEREMKRAFDLSRDAGLRVFLLRVNEAESLLQLCLHNTLFDQSSVLVLLKEVSQHYSALIAKQEARLPAAPQYVDYVRSQERLSESGVEERLEYWRKWFGRGDPPKWNWHPSKQAPANPGFHSHVTWLRFPPELGREIQAFSQCHGITPYISLMAAYAVLLKRYTDCADLTIGTTYSNRHDWQFANLIGATIDVPALRFDLTGDLAWPELLAQVRDVIAAALTHQDIPRDRVMPGSTAGPLFRVVFSYFAETPHGQLQLPGVEVTFLEETINQLSRPDLYLVVFSDESRGRGGLAGYWMHKQDAFTAETARQMSRDFEVLLSAMVGVLAPMAGREVE